MTGPDRSETTRRQLCLAAEAFVATHGLTSLTLRKVAVAAGQRNTAAVSYHFGNIDKLLRAIVEMRLRDTEEERRRLLEESGLDGGQLDAFHAWRCLVWPGLALSDEKAPHAHIRFLAHMSVAGLLSDPFDSSAERPGAPTIRLLLKRLNASLSHLPYRIARARIALCGMMFWNTVMLHDQQALGHDDAALGLPALLADVETLVRRILSEPITEEPPETRG